MLDSFRSLSNSIFAKILLGLLVLSFGVWGVGDMVRHQGLGMTVATVGGTSITTDEFLRALRRETENIRRILGDRYSPELVRSLNLPQQVLQKLITRTLMALESRSLGLLPSDGEVVGQIRGNPAFQDSKGNFSKAAFEGMLKGIGMSEKAYIEQLRQDMGSNLLLATLSSAAPVSDIAVRTLYDAQEELRTVALYSVTSSLVTGTPSPTEAQIAAYYDAHKNDFTAPEYRTISYVTITPADVPTIVVSEDELQAAYKERIDEFKHPERRAVEQLLYSSEEKAKAAKALLKAGKTFAEVAKETDILNKDSLSLSKVERNAILQNAAEAVFSLPAGGHTDPIQSPFGWHIFGVSAIEPPSVSPFEEVRPQLEKDLKQRDAGEAQSKFANKLQDALAGGATLQEAAKDLKLKISSVGPVDHSGLAPDGSELKNIPDLDKFIDTAFKTDDKTESSLITSKGGVYYILRIGSITPERLRALDEVRGLAVASWQKEARLKNAAQLARDAAAAFVNPADRAAIIAKYNLQPVTGSLKRTSTALGNLSLPSGLADDIFRHKLQESTGAYTAGNGIYLIAVVTNVIAAPPPDKDSKLTGMLADIRHNLTENTQNEMIEEYTRYLMTKYGVSVNDAALQAVLK